MITLEFLRDCKSQGMKIKDIASLVGKSKWYVSNQIKMLNVEYDLDLVRDEAISEFKRGVSCSKLAKRFRVSIGTMSNQLEQWGMPKRLPIHDSLDEQCRRANSLLGGAASRDAKKQSYEDLKYLVDLYHSGKSMRQISQDAGLSDLTVKKVLEFHNVCVMKKEDYIETVSKKSYDKFFTHTIYEQPFAEWGYDYSLVTPEQWQSGRITPICPKHGQFSLIKSNHVSLNVGCAKCSNSGPSRGELEVAEFVSSLGVDVVQGDRTILGRKELDIFVPSHRLAIEYNGLYWHSSTEDSKENRLRHVDKTNRAERLGIQLLHILSSEWEDSTKRNIWKSVIRTKLGFSDRIFARKTRLAEVSKEEARKFHDKNHLQGSINGRSVGLWSDERLVMVLTYGQSRFEKNAVEILRMCSALDTVVVGGFSKLLKYLVERCEMDVVSYANRRWSNGGVYRATGLTQEKVTQPNYWYVLNGHTLKSRMSMQKHKLVGQLDVFDPQLTEKQNVLSNSGYRILYDSGNIKFRLAQTTR